EHLAVGLLDAIHGGPLSLVARSAAELFRGMRVVRKQDFAIRVGAKGLSFLFKTRPIDGDVTSLAAVHAEDGLVEVVALELRERHLFNTGNLVERKEFQIT